MSNELLTIKNMQLDYAALRGFGAPVYDDKLLMDQGRLAYKDARKEFVVAGMVPKSDATLQKMQLDNPKIGNSKHNTDTDVKLRLSSSYQPKLIVLGEEIEKDTGTFKFGKGSIATADVTVSRFAGGAFPSYHLVAVNITQLNLAEQLSHADIEADLKANHIS